MTSTYLLMVNNGQRIEFSRNELRGLDYLRPLETLLIDLTADKTLDRLAAAGQATPEQVEAARTKVDADFAALAAVDAQVGSDLRTTGANLNANILPATLAKNWHTWESGRHDPGTDDAFHSQLVTDVRTLISYVGVTSNLVLDPELSPYHIADALAVRAPAIIDHTRSVGDTVDGLVADGRVTLPDRTGVAATVATLTSDADGLQEDLFTIFQDGGGSAEARAVQNALGPLLTSTYLDVANLGTMITQDFVQAAQLQLSRPALSHAVDQAIGAVSALSTALSQREGVMLQARIDMDSMGRQLALAAVLAVLAVTVLLVVWQSRRITTDVGTVSRVAASLAGGDLTGRARVRSRDEIGVMATAFNGMAEQLQQMVEEQQRAERTLRSERDFVDAVLEIAGSLVLVIDKDGRIVRFNRACELTTGYAADDVVGKLCWELFLLPEDRPCIEEQFDDLQPSKFPHNFECPWLTKAGEQRRIAWSNTALVDESAAVTHVIATGIDVTAQRAAEAALREAKERFQKAFDHASIGMCLVDIDGRFTQVNRALCEMLGRPEDELLALRIADVTHPDDLSATVATVAVAKDGYSAPHRLEKRYLRSDGRTVWAQVTVCTIHSENGESPYFVTQVEDVTERREAEARLVRQALHDPLTGLPNRTLLMDRLRQVLARADRHPELTAVLFIDLDGFKDVNDSLGHDVGDEVLTEVGRRLQDNIRPLDTVARLGGDEFVVLCQDLATEQNVVEISERLAGVLSEPVVVGTFEVVVTASVGIALANGHNPAPEDLLREADAAMYGAKTRGKNRCEIFDAGLQERAVDRIAIASALRQGLRDDRFVLHFQPVVDMDTGDTVAVESLVRLDDPDRGLLAPDTFIQVAEDSGLIVPIGTSVLEQACRQLVTWRKTGAAPAGLRTAVNLSARQANRPDLAATIERALAETGLEPSGLTLELTETVLMEADAATLRQLERIRELGVGLGIDDFGTGYSSLTYLKRLPVSFVKIDRSFVAGLVTDPSDREIVTAVIRLGQALGLTTIAEGVEEPAQFEMLRALGCDQAQGYLLGRPKPGPPGDIAALRTLRTAVS
ncbi:EAL domain-containing protein [Kutzneria kofuensis]|uniref:Diguanylate cyclase (GGDEF)-like protein/PAS domain S-box-containing protein n=1 Tax=Kutzneria kofuensis TaxID=103725 RepID=A0A7W9KQU3_9PSEU|nr:EAL domain-containing protein [Kutzneria kofuensis]MBB5897046.1 diguanylate cyclase (GGDEF)-like protein/PAS domain S-box-containing protein [Kutzneria kofuensis]